MVYTHIGPEPHEWSKMMRLSNTEQDKKETKQLSISYPEIAPMSSVVKTQRQLLALWILLAPLSISIYAIAWAQDLKQPLLASAQAGPTGNLLHFIGVVAASFFLPLGYLGVCPHQPAQHDPLPDPWAVGQKPDQISDLYFPVRWRGSGGYRHAKKQRPGSRTARPRIRRIP
jgi:hypothetical protein